MYGHGNRGDATRTDATDHYSNQARLAVDLTGRALPYPLTLHTVDASLELIFREPGVETYDRTREVKDEESLDPFTEWLKDPENYHVFRRELVEYYQSLRIFTHLQLFYMYHCLDPRLTLADVGALLGKKAQHVESAIKGKRLRDGRVVGGVANKDARIFLWVYAQIHSSGR
jgi:hypothetical protein